MESAHGASFDLPENLNGEVYRSFLVIAGCKPVAKTIAEFIENGIQGEADARLISAAPDLLAACKEALMLAAHGIGAVNTSNDPDCKANADRNVAECIRIQNLVRAAIAKAGGAA